MTSPLKAFLKEGTKSWARIGGVSFRFGSRRQRPDYDYVASKHGVGVGAPAELFPSGHTLELMVSRRLGHERQLELRWGPENLFFGCLEEALAYAVGRGWLQPTK